MLKRLIPETSVSVGDFSTETIDTAINTIIETDVLPWIESFNNISFIESENNYSYYNIGSNTVIMFLHWHSYLPSSGHRTGTLEIGLCRKDSKNIIISWTGSADFIKFSTNGKYVVPNFELHALADKENNLTVLYINGDFTLPASNCPYIFFDIDETGKKYIGFKEDNISRKIFYLDDKRVIQCFYSTGKKINNKALSYFNENYIIMEKVQIFNSLSSQFTSLSTNMVRVINQVLNTDKETNFTVIEVDGDKYRKLEYDIWIKDND